MKRTYSADRSLKNTSASPPDPGSVSAVLDLVALDERRQLAQVLDHRLAGRHDEPALDLEVGDERPSRRVAPCPAAWRIRPKFGSPPCSAVLTSGELAIARATGSTSASLAGDDDPPDPPGPLPVGHDLQRQRAHRDVHRLAELQLVVGLGGSTVTPEAPLASTNTVSLVES